MYQEYPKMLYKTPGPHEIAGGHFDTRIVQDEQQEAEAIAAGWFLTTGEAKNPPPPELEQKASEPPDEPPLTAVGAAPEQSDEPEQAGQPQEPQPDQPPHEQPEDSDLPPTRAELEQKASELNIQFKPSISDAKLAERIAAKLAEQG